MALTRKPSQQSAVSGAATLPDEMPKLPDDMRARFPSAAEYEKNLAQWYYQVRLSLQRQQEDVAAELTARIIALEKRIAALEP